MMDGNLVFPGPPYDRNYCGEEVYRVGMGARGQLAAGEGIKWFQMCTFFNSDVVVSGAKIFDALLNLKFWYSFYIRVEYQRLHENNLAQRNNVSRVWVPPPPP